MLMKSTCRRCRGAVATMGHKEALGKPPSCWKQCMQALIDCLICLAIPGYKKHSCNKDKVWSWPWCLASWWHPFRAAIWYAFGTRKSNRSSFSPLGIDRGHSGESWNSDDSSTPFNPLCWKHALQGVSSDWSCSGSLTSSAWHLGLGLLWAVAQLVICISACTCPAATCTSFSILWSPSTTEGSWPSALWAIPRVTPSRMDCTASGPRGVVIQPRASATVLSHPFWYSNWKLNLARAPTHHDQ